VNIILVAEGQQSKWWFYEEATENERANLETQREIETNKLMDKGRERKREWERNKGKKKKVERKLEKFIASSISKGRDRNRQ
jgi:hypothetical protein